METFQDSPTIPELAARKWPGDKKMQVKVIEICTTLKKKRLKDDFEVNLKRMSDVSMITQEQCTEIICWYQSLLLDTKFIIK